MPRMDRIGRAHTQIVDRDGILAVTYHDTVIVEVNGRQVPAVITLRCGGHTATTRRRMNQVANYYGLRFQVTVRNGVWYVSRSFRDGSDLPGYAFYDGITLSHHLPAPETERPGRAEDCDRLARLRDDSVADSIIARADTRAARWSLGREEGE